MTSTHEKVRYAPNGKRHTPVSAAEGVEGALKILEGRWKLTILFHLFGGKLMRFSDLERAIPARPAEHGPFRLLNTTIRCRTPTSTFTRTRSRTPTTSTTTMPRSRLLRVVRTPIQTPLLASPQAETGTRAPGSVRAPRGCRQSVRGRDPRRLASGSTGPGEWLQLGDCRQLSDRLCTPECAAAERPGLRR